MKCHSFGLIFGTFGLTRFVFNEQRNYFSLLGKNQINTLPAGVYIPGSRLSERAEPESERQVRHDGVGQR